MTDAEMDEVANAGWTVATSHVHLLSLINAADKRYEQRFIAQEGAILAALAAQEKAVAAALVPVKEAMNKAETANDKRFDDLRKEADQRNESLSDKIDGLTTRLAASDAASATASANQRDGRSSGQWNITTVIAFLSLLASIAVVAFVAVHG